MIKKLLTQNEINIENTSNKTIKIKNAYNIDGKNGFLWINKKNIMQLLFC